MRAYIFQMHSDYTRFVSLHVDVLQLQTYILHARKYAHVQMICLARS
jgi:hypothetical protein